MLARMGVLDVPLLEPLTITEAKYLPDQDAVILKLSLPNGSEAIAYTPSYLLHDNIVYQAERQKDFLWVVSGSLLPRIPELPAKELQAIKDRTLFRGMSAEAVDYALDFKDSENDWGHGGKQQVYYGGRLLVYLNNSDKVEDWQHFDK